MTLKTAGTLTLTQHTHTARLAQIQARLGILISVNSA